VGWLRWLVCGCGCGCGCAAILVRCAVVVRPQHRAADGDQAPVVGAVPAAPPASDAFERAALVRHPNLLPARVYLLQLHLIQQALFTSTLSKHRLP